MVNSADMITQSSCPCGSDQPYSLCCEPLHQQKSAATSAEQLMRSRYSAYSLGLTEYIFATTLPAQQPQLDRDAINEWAAQCRFVGLTICSSLGGLPGEHEGQVEFIARFYVEGSLQAQEHHEHSLFRFRQQRWFFVDPTLGALPQRNASCPCGSGRKYKKCCG